jgi:sugar phosphate isomerase/epimerase
MLQNKLAIASISLGQHAAHTLPLKIAAAAEAGIRGIEITRPDLDQFANALSLPILEVARRVRKLCADTRLEIIAFASFQNFEGQKSPLRNRLQTAREWIAIADSLGAVHLQVPSNFDRSANADPQVVASDLQHLCDMAKTLNPVVKIAYENLGWGTHCSTWQHALQIVQDVGRDNFGLCLDSFHFTVALWADPFSNDGKQSNGDKKLKEPLETLVKELPLEKLFYLQLSDGERLNPTYSGAHPWYDSVLEPAHVWSNEARPFPLETEYGSYMPVQEVAHAFLVDLGYKGWVSMETFDRRMRSEHQGPSQNARRAVRSWETLRLRLLETEPILSKL